jgi:carbamoyl-phosphate synthase large subunit
MRSTGEVMGIREDLGTALAAAQEAAGVTLPAGGCVFVSVANRDKRSIVMPIGRLAQMGFRVLATRGTASLLARAGVPAQPVPKRSEGSPDATDLIEAGEIQLVINTPFGRGPRTDGYFIRTAAARAGVPCITTIAGLIAAVQGIEAVARGRGDPRPLQALGGALPSDGAPPAEPAVTVVAESDAELEPEWEAATATKAQAGPGVPPAALIASPARTGAEGK